MTNEISYERIARTKDSNNSVVHATYKNSYMIFILDSTHNSVNIYIINSEEKGDMKHMLDDLMSNLSTDKIYFLWPTQREEKEAINKVYKKYGINAFDGKDLKDVLEGFEEKWVNWDGKDVHVLEGTWKTE